MSFKRSIIILHSHICKYIHGTYAENNKYINNAYLITNLHIFNNVVCYYF